MNENTGPEKQNSLNTVHIDNGIPKAFFLFAAAMDNCYQHRATVQKHYGYLLDSID